MTIHISVELSHICPVDEITTHAKALEANGFHRVWIPDTVVSPWEAWFAASLIMQHTTNLQIGLGVTNPYTRHPVVVAQMAATMQQYSGGRLSISLGRGIGRFLEKAGIKQHVKAVEECVHVIRGLIAGERTSFSGDVFQIDAMKLRTQPPDKPVPIYLAAVGPAGWDNAIRVADGVATFYSDKIAETRQQFMTERIIPVAVLIPFSLSRTDFFESRVTSIDELRERVAILEETGFDEVIVAYGDIKDLETAAQLLGASV
jgi:alkanesulfonate monooxygenase SsuD/methylene tetrahydromethanopterin reductase-like flavin-dependent oxidoreductase (luciferase family)